MTLRIIDTGLRSGRENVAFDQALIEAHNAGTAPDTIRFLRFRPCALVGLHQMLSHEVRFDYCAANGIEVDGHQARNEVLAASIRFVQAAAARP